MDQPNAQQQLTFPLDPASVQILVAALTPYFSASLVQQIVAGVAISVSPSSGQGTVTVTNAGVASLIAGSGISISGSTGNITVTCTLTDAQLSTSDITTNNVSTSKHGFAPKAPNDATKYLDGTGTYSVPAGSGGSFTAKVGVDFRLLNASSGNQTEAHGLGKTPTFVRIVAYVFRSNGAYFLLSDGAFNGTNAFSVSGATDHSSTGVSDANGNMVNLLISSAGQTATISVDSTNITLAWTKVGSPAGDTIFFRWEAWG
jgi:hypothetical protein